MRILGRLRGRAGGRHRAWRLAAAVCVSAAILLAADASRPPARQFGARTALAGIEWYQAHVSGRLGPVCRFTPTCSTYAKTVVARHGLVRGGWLAVKRIARCGPWTPVGTHDPPP